MVSRRALMLLLPCVILGASSCSTGPTEATLPVATGGTAAPSSTSSGPGGSSSTRPPSPAVPSAAAPSSTQATVGSPVLLTEDAPVVKEGGVTQAPYIAWTALPGWTQTITDKDGKDQWQHAAKQCLLTSFNLRDPSTGTDDAVTGMLLDNVVEKVTAKAKEPTSGPEPSVVVPRAASRSVQFAQRKVEYTNADDGLRWVSYFLGRKLGGDGLFLATNLSCPTAAFTAAPTLRDEIYGGLRLASALHH